MPLNLPNLDDRSYNDLVQEAIALLPTYAPDWTNHNPSDPGITLVEVFAYLTEMLIYRVDQVTDANYLAFLKLIKGTGWTPSPTETLTQQIRDAVLELREPNRAVTDEDFERLACEADPNVARARCLPRRNLESENVLAPNINKPGHVSVVIVPASAATSPQPDAALIQKVKDYLEPRRLLTTQLHVVSPRYFTFGVRLTLQIKPDAIAESLLDFVLDSTLQSNLDSGTFSAALRQAFLHHNISLSPNVTLTVQLAGVEWLVSDYQTDQYYLVKSESGQLNVQLNVYVDTARIAAIRALKQFFDPLTGGGKGEGWPFGRNVFVSEIYQLLDQLPGIDYVDRTVDSHTKKPLDELIEPEAGASRRIPPGDGDLVGLAVEADELIDVRQMTFDLTINTA
jgi:hypothetical protein